MEPLSLWPGQVNQTYKGRVPRIKSLGSVWFENNRYLYLNNLLYINSFMVSGEHF